MTVKTSFQSHAYHYLIQKNTLLKNLWFLLEQRTPVNYIENLLFEARANIFPYPWMQ